MDAIEGGIMARGDSAGAEPDIHSVATEKRGVWNGGKMKERNHYGNICKKKGNRLIIPGSESLSDQVIIGIGFPDVYQVCMLISEF